MLRKKCLSIFFLFLSVLCAAQYRVEDIPPALVKNADAVVRIHETGFSIQSPAQASLKIKYAITILNEKGNYLSVFTAFYDKFRKASFISGALYDKDGRLQTRVTRNNVRDYTSFSGSFYDDNRMLAYEPVVRAYPYTVEYVYEISYSGLLNFPVWMPVSNTRVSLEKASYRMDMPDQLSMRYHQINLEDSARTYAANKRMYSEWNVSSFPALEFQSFSRPIIEYLPAVFSAPVVFSIDQSPGSMKSWGDFASWIYNLNAGRDVLPEKTRSHIRELVKDADDRIDKARIIYEYMQSKTRYVSIQLGIGSWQPFEAGMVDQNGYGDCKALANYTRALLSAAGIESYYALVRAGSEPAPFFENMPSNQFNHVILCLPAGNDSIWLECTSQHIPFGYLSDFSDNRQALIIKEKGGHLARTISYGESENQRARQATIIVDSDGNAMVNMTTEYSGLYSDACFEVFRYGPQDQRKWYTEYIGLPGFQPGEFRLTPEFSAVPRIKADMEFSVKNYSSRTGRRLFVPLNQFSRWTRTVPTPPEILRDVYLRNSFVHRDEFSFALPDEFRIEALPEAVDVSSRFGSYTFRVEEKDGRLFYYRELLIKSGFHPDKPYAELSDFLKKVYLADQAQLVLIRD